MDTYERARRAIHEIAQLLEKMAQEDLKLVKEIDLVMGETNLRREDMKTKIEAIRVNAARIRKETKR